MTIKSCVRVGTLWGYVFSMFLHLTYVTLFKKELQSFKYMKVHIDKRHSIAFIYFNASTTEYLWESTKVLHVHVNRRNIYS